MEGWNHIINTALLGTDKSGLRKEYLPADLADRVDLMLQDKQNKEDIFLQTAALLYNYRQCGILPLHEVATPLRVAEDEEKKICRSLST